MCTPELAVLLCHEAGLLPVRGAHLRPLARGVGPGAIPLLLAPRVAQTKQPEFAQTLLELRLFN